MPRWVCRATPVEKRTSRCLPRASTVTTVLPSTRWRRAARPGPRAVPRTVVARAATVAAGARAGPGRTPRPGSPGRRVRAASRSRPPIARRGGRSGPAFAGRGARSSARCPPGVPGRTAPAERTSLRPRDLPAPRRSSRIRSRAVVPRNAGGRYRPSPGFEVGSSRGFTRSTERRAVRYAGGRRARSRDHRGAARGRPSDLCRHRPPGGPVALRRRRREHAARQTERGVREERERQRVEEGHVR